MCEAVGRKVLALHRSKIGNIGVKDIELGKWRYLNQKEVEQLVK
jgi:16S rRNA U516 pseudouridylate synthase RsuA-like enzyme